MDVEGKWEWVTGENFAYSNWVRGHSKLNPKTAPNADFAVINWPGSPRRGEWMEVSASAKVTGFFVEYEEEKLSGCVDIEERFPIYGTDGGGWMLVRRVKAGTKWHPTTDSLLGSQAAYGVWTSDPTADATFGEKYKVRVGRLAVTDSCWGYTTGIPFDHIQYDQFMFATGDGQEWLIADKSEVQSVHKSFPFKANIRMSSLRQYHGKPYQAKWYNRGSSIREDPWISLVDHDVGKTRGQILYGEASFAGPHAATVLPVHNGANVFVRLQANRDGCVEHDVTQVMATPVASVMRPSGGGNHDITVIMDGVTPLEGSQDSREQYDFCCGHVAADNWVGYQFQNPLLLSKLVFTEGKHFSDGGWFVKTPVVEYVPADGSTSWIQATAVKVSPDYAHSQRVGAHATTYETFTFSFEKVKCKAIRIRGAAGGSQHFISVAELRVFALTGADC